MNMMYECVRLIMIQEKRRNVQERLWLAQAAFPLRCVDDSAIGPSMG